MNIRKATIQDVDNIFQLGKYIDEFKVNEKNSFWQYEQLVEWVKSSNTGKDVILVSKDDNGHIVGFVLSQLHRPTGKATIENLFVKEEFRNQGLAIELLNNCILELKKSGASFICLLAQSDHKKLVSYYEKNGFKKGMEFYWFHKDL